MSTFTELKVKDLQRFFSIKNYEAARRIAVHIKDLYKAQMLTPALLALYLGLPESKVLEGLK